MRKEGYTGEYLSEKDIIEIHTSILEESGTVELLNNGRYIDGTGNLFQMSVNSIFSGFGDIEFYPTIVDKASALCFNIVKNHVFRDGNKRTATISMLATLEMNNLKCTLTDEELAEIVTRVGDNRMEFEEFNEIINQRVVLNTKECGQTK